MEEMIRTNRLLAAPIMAAIVLGLILMSAFLPMVKMSPKHIPVGIVAADEGEIGQTLASKFLENAPETVKFIPYDSVEQLESAMNERDVYGALVLPADFSGKIGTLQTEKPEKATVQIYINEGANATVSALMQNALTNMVTMLNVQLSTQMLTAVQQKADEMKAQLAPVLQAQGNNSPLAQLGNLISPIQPSKVLDYANPVQTEIIKVNETGQLSNAPIAFLTGTWFTSMIGGVVLYLTGNKRKYASRADQFKWNIVQTILPFVYALVAGYVLTWYSTWLYGFEYEHFHKVALYIAICVAAFTWMIFATLRWLKLPSMAIYVLLMFFSMAAAQLAPEMLPAFYRDYIVSWLPIRIYAEGLREVLFFSKNLINNYSLTLIWIMVIGLIIVWLKNVLEKTETKESVREGT